MGHIIGNAMAVNVLERLMPRVLFSMGWVDEVFDPWEWGLTDTQSKKKTKAKPKAKHKKSAKETESEAKREAKSDESSSSPDSDDSD
jgi:sortase (surface protein transpeptidase)